MLVEDIDRTVIERARDGDGSAKKQIYDCYSRYLSATCARFLPDPVDQGDVLQESFIKIFTSLDRFEFRGEGSFKAWVRQILVNEALKLLRKRRQSFFVRLDRDLPEEEYEELPEGEEDVGDVPSSVLQEMIKCLPEGYRTVLNLFAFEKKNHREIGRMLGISESTSASQLHRARTILMTKINDYKKRNKKNDG